MKRTRSRPHDDKMTGRPDNVLDRLNIKNFQRMNDLSHRLCVAPMMDWTDRHCRYFLRLITRARAALHRDDHERGARRTATFRITSISIRPSIRSRCSSAAAIRAVLAHGAKLGERWGYDEINLNCGCPSERVQKGSFGACLMAEPALVADCVKAMRDAVALPVTVKHRIGLDDDERLRVRPRLRRHGRRGGLRGVHRPRAQCRAEGAVAEGEPRGAAACATTSCTG